VGSGDVGEQGGERGAGRKQAGAHPQRFGAAPDGPPRL